MVTVFLGRHLCPPGRALAACPALRGGLATRPGRPPYYTKWGPSIAWHGAGPL